MIRIWANYSLAVMPGLKTDAGAKLEEARRTQDDNGKLAEMLSDATTGPLEERDRRLDEATMWMREHHPQAAKIWATAGGGI